MSDNKRSKIPSSERSKRYFFDQLHGAMPGISWFLVQESVNGHWATLFHSRDLKSALNILNMCCIHQKEEKLRLIIQVTPTEKEDWS